MEPCLKNDPETMLLEDNEAGPEPVKQTKPGCRLAISRHSTAISFGTLSDENTHMNGNTESLLSKAKGKLGFRDYAYTINKYTISFLMLSSIIYAVQSINHLSVYVTPLIGHIFSLALRGWDLYQLFTIFAALHNKNIHALDEGLKLLRKFVVIYALANGLMLAFTDYAMVYLTGYLATAAYIDGDAAIFKSRVVMVFFVELFICLLISCGALWSRGYLERSRCNQRKVPSFV